ncbi:MAG: hypothetical protein Q8O19_00505 [Rectinemataceae bacterium]|nr:hypothetical protein [Rectinemataceae bacterium]
MLGFFFKKAFFDGWDHLFSLVALNLVFLGVFSLVVVLPMSLGLSGLATLVPVSMAILLLSVWYSACVHTLRRVADYGSVSFRDVPGDLKSGLVPGLQMAAIGIAGWILVSVGLPFYLSNGGLLGVFAAGILFWCALIALLSLQYYIPLRARLGGGFRKNIRKSFIMFFDNAGFSIFLLFYNFITLILSFFLAFMAPGPAGVALSLDVAVRLRMKKYDWLEENPGVKRKEIPWTDLLEEDKELVGPRTLKGMIFPWKDK